MSTDPERELARKNVLFGWALFAIFLVLAAGTVAVVMLDIEDPRAIAAELDAAGVAAAGFADFLSGEGRALHDRLRAEAEARGVFGVPAYLVDDELFWGNERLERVRERVVERR